MTLSSRLVVVTLAAVAPVAVSLGYTYGTEQARQTARVEQQARRSAELLAAEAARLLGEARQELLRLSLLPAVRDGHREGCNERLARTVADNPLFATLLRVDRWARPVCASHPLPAIGWAQHPTSRALAMAGRFAVSGYLSAGATPSVVVSLPVFDPSYRSVPGAGVPAGAGG